jgi:hypothetical protein
MTQNLKLARIWSGGKVGVQRLIEDGGLSRRNVSN